jgi:hypothetical protein
MMPDRNAYRGEGVSPDLSCFEPILQDFEQAWLDGQRPELGEYLARAPASGLALLVELAHLDLEYRLKAGESARVEDYLRRFPELDSSPQELIELIVAEHQHCRALGRTPAVDDYLERFPQHRTALLDRLGRSDETTKDRTGEAGGTAADLPARLGRYRIEGKLPGVGWAGWCASTTRTSAGRWP